MKCVIDANILIDLNNGDILPLLFKLTLLLSTPDLVLDELIKPDRITLLQMGVRKLVLSPEQLIEVVQMQADEPRLSLGDCAAFVRARDDKVMLITGDKRLREKAVEISLETHGVLWVLDEIEAAQLLNPPQLATSLQKMLDEGARLPYDECQKRFQRWTGRG